MQIKIILILLLFIQNIAKVQAQSKANQSTCPKNSYFNITSLVADNYDDLRFLKPLVADKRVVLLGESSHGIGDYYSIKSRLVKFLHQECGFEILSLESGIADVFLEYAKIDSASALTLRNNTVYGNFQCKEIMPLFNYIKTVATQKKPLIYSGFDSQNFTASFGLLSKIAKDLLGAAGDSLVNNLGKYYKIPPLLWQADKQPLFRLADTIGSSAKILLTQVKKEATAIKTKYRLSDLGYKMLLRALANHIEGVAVDWNNEDPSAKRDSLMASNLFWLMDEIHPGKKFIIWAHNAHIDKKSPMGNPYKWMGHFIKQRFGKSSFHIGLFSQNGETFEWWTKTNKPFKNTGKSDVELISGFYDNTFINLTGEKKCKWASSAVFGYEVENGGKVQFVPAERFDAIITLKNVTLPTYK